MRALVGALVALVLSSPAVAATQSGTDQDGFIGKITSRTQFTIDLAEIGPILLQGNTTIYPYGLTLKAGMWVHVYGHKTADAKCAADYVYLLAGGPREGDPKLVVCGGYPPVGPLPGSNSDSPQRSS